MLIVIRIVRYRQFDRQLVHLDDRPEQVPRSFLNKLAHRVQVRAEIDGRRVDTLMVLALALAVQLLPPLGEIVQARLVVDEDLDRLALLVERIANGGILLPLILCQALVRVERLGVARAGRG